MLDRSERGKLALAGPDAIEFLNGQVTNELADLPVGEGRYAAFLNHKGGMLGDLRVLHAVDPGAPELGPVLLLDTERASLQPLFDMVRCPSVGFDVELHKRTLRARPALAHRPRIRGPRGRRLTRPERARQRGARRSQGSRRSRCAATSASTSSATPTAPRHSLARCAPPVPCQPTRRRSTALRIEHGRPLFGVDVQAGTIPQEAGLNERAVSFTKGCYVGQETVARLFYKGRPNRHLRGLAAATELRGGEALTLDGRAVGEVGSAAVSPRFGPIALALLRREAEPGARLEREDGGDATVVELPFAAVAAAEPQVGFQRSRPRTTQETTWR